MSGYIRSHRPYKKNGNYYVDFVIDIEDSSMHVLPGFEVKISTSKGKVSSVATINDIEYCGDDFYDDAKTLVYATVKVPSGYEYLNYSLEMNDYDADSFKVKSCNGITIY